MPRAALLSLLLLAAPISGCLGSGPVEGVLRLGFFATVPHGQALVGVDSGLYARHLAPTTLQVRVLPAGPAAFEALLAGQLDVVLAGPAPTAAAFAATGPGVLRVISGAASGGAGLVVQPHLAGARPPDFAGRTLATPQLGNTQDIALKAWLDEGGAASRDRGGQVEVINVPNPDLFLLFRQGRIDGGWVPEPWLSRLVEEAGGTLRVDEADLWPHGAFVTTHVVTTRAFLEARPDDVRRLLAAHVEATRNMQGAGAGATFNAALRNFTGKDLPAVTADRAVANVNFTWDPLAHTFMEGAAVSRQLGYLRRDLPPASDVYDLRLLNEVLIARGLPEVKV